jgi:hypothetical protein
LRDTAGIFSLADTSGEVDAFDEEPEEGIFLWILVEIEENRVRAERLASKVVH